MEISSFSETMAFQPIFRDKLSHAYIISGPAGSGKSSLADTLAAAIVCSGEGMRPCGICRDCRKAIKHIHPDIIFIDKADNDKAILVNQIRALRSDAIVMPNDASKKVYIIKNAGTMNDFAQNAILKLLEEPPRHAAFILITENPSELLPTVRSRCVSFLLTPPQLVVSPEALEEAEEFFVALEKGNLAITEFSFRLDGFQPFESFVSAAKGIAIARLRDEKSGKLSPQYLNHVINALDRALEYTGFNVGSGHIAGMLCAELLQ